MHHPGQALVTIVMVKSFSSFLFLFCWSGYWTPAPELCAETLHDEVERLSDVRLDTVRQDQSSLCSEKEEDVHQN